MTLGKSLFLPALTALVCEMRGLDKVASFVKGGFMEEATWSGVLKAV